MPEGARQGGSRCWSRRVDQTGVPPCRCTQANGGGNSNNSNNNNGHTGRVSLGRPRFQSFTGVTLSHPRHGPLQDIRVTRVLQMRRQGTERLNTNQGHTADKKGRWNLKQGCGPPEHVFSPLPPHHSQRLLLPSAQRPQLSKLEPLSCLLHILLPSEARLPLLKHKSDWALSCSNTSSAPHCPLLSGRQPHQPAALCPASLPSCIHPVTSALRGHAAHTEKLFSTPPGPVYFLI